MRLFQNFTQSIILGKTSGSIYCSPVMIILGTLETSSLSLFFFKNVCAAKRQSCILPLFTQVFCETGSWQLLELMSAYSASSAVNVIYGWSTLLRTSLRGFQQSYLQNDLHQCGIHILRSQFVQEQQRQPYQFQYQQSGR